MGKNRNYSCKDVEMLMTSKTIAESFKANITGLSAIRTNWTPEYATTLGSRIDDAIETHMGIDARKDLRNATSTLEAIQIPAKRDVSFFKTQIDDDFKKEPAKKEEILRTLGFTKYLKGVQDNNQESLIQLLYQFKKSMTEGLKQDITAKGMSATLIDNIMGYASTFSQANVAQESLKGSTKEITQEVTEVFNAIYDEIIGICKIASKFYQYEPLKKEQFTFTKVLARLGATIKSAEEATV